MPESEAFDVAVEIAKSDLPSSVSQSDKLKIYALYKCATVGPTPSVSRPGAFSVVNRAKYDAWVVHGDSGMLTGSDAKDRYVELISSLAGRVIKGDNNNKIVDDGDNYNTVLPLPPQASPCRSWIFGYGSLISPESRLKTCDDLGCSAFPSIALSVTVSGLSRGWYTPVDLPENPVDRPNPTITKVTAVGIVSATPSSSCGGVIFSVPPSSIPKFDVREIGRASCRERV